MDERRSGSRANESGASGLRLLEKLERRVLVLMAELEAAREARWRAEAEVDGLRQQVLDQDSRIVLLEKQQDCDELRRAVRERVEALLQRVDKLEREG